MTHHARNRSRVSHRFLVLINNGTAHYPGSTTDGGTRRGTAANSRSHGCARCSANGAASSCQEMGILESFPGGVGNRGFWSSCPRSPFLIVLLLQVDVHSTSTDGYVQTLGNRLDFQNDTVLILDRDLAAATTYRSPGTNTHVGAVDVFKFA
jgi:hypothetical protein